MARKKFYINTFRRALGDFRLFSTLHTSDFARKFLSSFFHPLPGRNGNTTRKFFTLYSSRTDDSFCECYNPDSFLSPSLRVSSKCNVRVNSIVLTLLGNIIKEKSSRCSPTRAYVTFNVCEICFEFYCSDYSSFR